MSKLKFVSVLVLLTLLLSAMPGAVVGQEPPPRQPEQQGCGYAELAKARFPATCLSTQMEELLAIVKTSPEFYELEANMVSMEPNNTWQAAGLTFFIFDLKPVAKPAAALRLYPYVIFAARKDQGIVAVLVATPNLHTMQVELKDFNNPEFSQTVMLSAEMEKELCKFEERKGTGLQEAQQLRSHQPCGPCAWYCTKTVYHPGHIDTNCRGTCWAGCGFIPDWRAKAACMAACYAACWVPGWTECVKWEWFCGLP